MRIKVFAFLLFLCSTVLLGTGSRSALGAEAAIDPKAEDVFRRSIDYYAKLQCMRVTVSQIGTVQIAGRKQTHKGSVNVHLKKPNKALIMIRRNKEVAFVRCDGKKFTLFFPKKREYIERDAPKDHAGLAEVEDLAAVGPGGLGLILFSLLGEGAYDAAMEGVTAFKYVAREKIDGVNCHRLRFVQKDLDVETWFAESEKPLLHRVSVDMSKMMKELAKKDPQMRGAKMSQVTHYRKWSTKAIPDSRFVFKPPKNARKVDSFAAASPGGPAGAGGSGRAGTAAPDFSLKLLDGKSMRLSQHKGKDIVVLDFWATWCGPCRRALPAIAEIANEYKDKGVVVYAVNQRESPAAIRRFLKSANIALAVALDAKGAVGDKFGVEGIPTTVIIDKSGKIRSVHSGYSPGLKSLLSREINAILAD